MSPLGMSANDGSPILDETTYLRQSIQDIIKTPIGQRIMRRNYGSNLMELIDTPLNEYSVLQIQASVANALLQQEKNIALKKVSIQQAFSEVKINIQGTTIHSGDEIQLGNLKLFDS